MDKEAGIKHLRKVLRYMYFVMKEMDDEYNNKRDKYTSLDGLIEKMDKISAASLCIERIYWNLIK